MIENCLAWGTSPLRVWHRARRVASGIHVALDALNDSCCTRGAFAALVARGSDGAREAEMGTHEALTAKRGHYAELYGMQARAYR